MTDTRKTQPVLSGSYLCNSIKGLLEQARRDGALEERYFDRLTQVFEGYLEAVRALENDKDEKTRAGRFDEPQYGRDYPGTQLAFLTRLAYNLAGQRSEDARKRVNAYGMSKLLAGMSLDDSDPPAWAAKATEFLDEIDKIRAELKA